jgi:hypothetical protein
MGRDPREARRRQTELDILQLADRMRVAVYREEAPLLERQRSELRIQVLPVRVAVEFHGNAQSGSRFEDAAPVGLQARAREHPAARVAQHVDARLLHHPQPPRGLVVRLLQQRMRRRDDQLESSHLRGRHAHAARDRQA